MSLTSNRQRRWALSFIALAAWILGPLAISPGETAALILGDKVDAKAVAPIFFPDGTVSADRTTAFVSSPKGGIQAIRLEDGKVLWTNDECKAAPWLAAPDRLIARGDHVFVLDLKNGGALLKKCDAPAYPKVNVPDRCTVSHELVWGARVTGDVLETTWYIVANIDRSKGRPFNFQGLNAFNKAAPVGTVKFHLDSGKAELQTDPKPADISQSRMPESAKPESQVPAGLPDKLVDTWKQYYKDQNGRIKRLGDKFVGVSMTLIPVGNEYLKKVDLNSWDAKSAQAAQPIELVKDKALNVANIVITEDGRHVAVQFSTSAVTIFSLTDGKAIAKEVKGLPSPEKAFVDGKRAYFTVVEGGLKAETPCSLKALDLESGKVVWENPVKPRNTRPLPPGR